MPDRPLDDRRDLGGDPACWAHEVDGPADPDPATGSSASPPDPDPPFVHLPEFVRRRMERLRQELEDSGVQVPALEESVLLREIDRARFPRRHERRFPSYGALVVTDVAAAATALADLGAFRSAAPRSAAREVRKLADGVQSFSFMTADHAELVVLATPVVREMELVRLRRSLGPGSTVVVRSDDGTVRVFDRHQIVIFDGTRWWTKPDAHEYTLSVRRAVPAAPSAITQSILDFCVHSAGPGAGGTMLVWCLDADATADLRRWSVSTGQETPIRLSLTVPAAHSAIRHVLFQVDGAAVVDPSGTVSEVGVHLRPSPRAHDCIDVPTELGTRHAAAMRTSYDVPGAVFFVVSEDGPVTVYHAGHAVASIDMAADDRPDRPS